MFVENLYKFIKYYGEGFKLKMLGFSLLSVVAGLMEFIGLALIYPFILLIIDAESIIHSKYYLKLASQFHISNILSVAFILGIVVVLVFILKNMFMVYILYLQNKFVSDWKLSISNKFMHYYLYCPYKENLKTAASEKIYNVNFLISQTLDGFVSRFISLCSNMIIVAIILVLLFSKFPIAAGITCGFILVSMFLQHRFFKGILKNVSGLFSKISVLNNQKVLECVNNLKEIRVLSAEDYFYDNWKNIQIEYQDVLVKNNFLGAISPYVIEILIVVSLFLLAGLISLQNLDNEYWMVASYAVLVAAIFRIAPPLGRIQTALNAISASRAFVKTIIAEYEHSDFNLFESQSNLVIDFKNNLSLENVSFSYGKTPVIKNLNLKISKGESVGIIGVSGAGKSTLADILMGLLPVCEGNIVVDDTYFDSENFASLRKLIGYVPQQINLIDASFRQNVAFGIMEKDINDARVAEVLKAAKLYDFVQGIDNGIYAPISSSASGLSQGQKQRLAIARALYRNPQILILDEATSALDVKIENEITEMLNSLKGEKTIIAIAHRLSTLKKCDRLIYLKDGELIDTGTFEELSSKYPDFEKLISLSGLGFNRG